MHALRWCCGGNILIILGFTMKEAIHPKYETTKVSCSCGNSFETRSTSSHNLELEVCSLCHPFYTGKQKIVDTAGRVDRFKQKFAGFGKLVGAKDNTAADAANEE